MINDVVEELERWLAVWPNHLAGSIDLEVVQRARDEIVALREIAARPSPELHALTKGE